MQRHLVALPTFEGATLTDDAEITYLVSEFYAPAQERGLRHDDPALAIRWPLPVADVSDKDAAWPLDHPVSPEDLACTIYHVLGIDPHALSLTDKQGRPVALVDGGRALTELFG